MKWFSLYLLLSTTVLGLAGEEGWRGQAYAGYYRVELASDYQSIDVKMETEDLKIRPVSWDDFSSYVSLFSDFEVMETYGNGKPWTAEDVYEKLRFWVGRWEEGADPFSAFSVFAQIDSVQTFVGHLLLEHGSHKGEAEVSFLFKKQYWNRGFAKQAVCILVKSYATYLSELGFYVNLNDPSVPAAPLRRLHARVRADHSYAARVLERAGMRHVDEEISNGIFFKDFIVTMSELIALDREWSQSLEEKEWGVHSSSIRRPAVE